MRSELRERIESLLAEDALLEVVDVRIGCAGKNSIQVLLDKEGGISLDDLTEINRRISKALDTWDLIPGAYILEVSSAGIERPLYKVESYARFSGRKVKVTLSDPVGNCPKKFSGIIAGTDGRTIRFDVQGELIDIPFSNIKKANLVFEM